MAGVTSFLRLAGLCLIPPAGLIALYWYARMMQGFRPKAPDLPRRQVLPCSVNKRLAGACLSLALLQWACGSGQSPAAPTPSIAPSATPAPTPTTPLPIAGAFRFTITMDPKCAGAFPPMFQKPRYDVEIKDSRDHSEIWFDSKTVEESPDPSAAPCTGSASGGRFIINCDFLDSLPLEKPPGYSFFVTLSAGSLIPTPATHLSTSNVGLKISYADDTGTSAGCEGGGPPNHISLTPR